MRQLRPYIAPLSRVLDSDLFPISGILLRLISHYIVALAVSMVIHPVLKNISDVPWKSGRNNLSKRFLNKGQLINSLCWLIPFTELIFILNLRFGLLSLSHALSLMIYL